MYVSWLILKESQHNIPQRFGFTYMAQSIEPIYRKLVQDGNPTRSGKM
jgi:hypothetical protein